MSPLRLGVGVAALTVILWTLGALVPAHPRLWTGLDLRWYFFPLYEAFYASLGAGAPLLWNPYQLCGVPLLGTLQGAFFYPFHVLYLLLPTGWALAASTVLHLALAAGTAAAFARRAGLSATAATLAGTLFATTGTMRAWQLWPYLLEACAWMPLGAIGILDLTGGHRTRGALILALATGASCLAGCPQGTVFAGYTWAALFIARLVLSGRVAGEAVHASATTVAALVAGGLLGAVTLLPAYETAQEGVRPTTTLSSAFLYPVGGIPTPGGVVAIWLMNGSYALLPAFALAPLALLSASRWLTAWAFCVGGLALLLSFGPATPVFRLFLLLPALGWFRLPDRLLVVAGFCVGILAGLGLDVLTRLLRTRAAAAVVAAATLAALTYQGLHVPHPKPPLPYRQSDVPWTSAQHEAYARLARMVGHDRVWPFSPGVAAWSLPPKLPTQVGLRSIEDYEPLPLRRQAEFFVYFLEGSTVYSHLVAPFNGRIMSLRSPKGREPPAARRRLLDLTATRFLLIPSPARARPDVADFIRDARLQPRPALASDLELVENPHALPRAYVTYRARRAPAARELLALMARPSFDPLVESWIEAEADLGAAADAPPRGAAATIVRDDPQVVEVQATLAAPGMVVLADTYAQGWSATVDGIPTPILATNHLFRGVPAPAGTHRIRFAYRPRSLALGAALSLLTALGLAAGALRLQARALT